MKKQLSVVGCRLSVVSRALLFLLALVVTVAAQTSRPNILWISTEDMSPDLGCYGDSYTITPNVDRLAARRCVSKRADWVIWTAKEKYHIAAQHPEVIAEMRRLAEEHKKGIPPVQNHLDARIPPKK